MSSKTFLTISKEECLVVYKRVIEHSDIKWDSSKSLANAGDLGGAVSMAIISVEEMIKALVVYLDGNGFEFRRIKGMDIVFNHHQIRFLIAYAMFVVGSFGEDLINFITRIRENPEQLAKMTESMKEAGPKYYEKHFKYYVLKKLALLKSEYKWFSQVDLFRQEGFYSDYEQQLKTPISITLEDYEKVIQRLEKVRKIGKGIIEAFEDKDPLTKEGLENLKKKFKQEKLYKHMETSLSKVRQTRNSPFDTVRKSFINE